MSQPISNEPEPFQVVENGKWVKCSICGGHGVYQGFECVKDCRCDAGWVWEYPKGQHAAYPGGPFVSG